MVVPALKKIISVKDRIRSQVSWMDEPLSYSDDGKSLIIIFDEVVISKGLLIRLNQV